MANAAPHAPRLGHKKSRKGCLKCRARRVKCDEVHPECGHCHRLGLQCGYPSGASSASPPPTSGSSENHPSLTPLQIPLTPASASTAASSSTSAFYANCVLQDDSELAEHRARRLMELRLMLFWTTRYGSYLEMDGVHRGPSNQLWAHDVPSLALRHDNLHYAVLAYAATQLLVQCSDDEELAIARQTYWTMALRGQQLSLAHRDTIHVEVASFAGYLIELNGFAMLRHRTIEPYTPPMEWFDIGRGAKQITPRRDTIPAGSLLHDIFQQIAFITDDPMLQEGAPVGPVYRSILDPSLSPHEFSDMLTIRAYESTLRYIDTFRRAVIAGERAHLSVRRVSVFHHMTPRRFIRLVQEQRPRALVVLACLFAIVAQSRALDGHLADPDRVMPKREVAAINNVLPAEWKPLMLRPLKEAFMEVHIHGSKR